MHGTASAGELSRRPTTLLRALAWAWRTTWAAIKNGTATLQTALRLSRRSGWRRCWGRWRRRIHRTRPGLRHDHATDRCCGRSRRHWSGRRSGNRCCRHSNFGRLRRRGSRSFAWCWRAGCRGYHRGCRVGSNRSCGNGRSADRSGRRCCGLYHNWRCRHRCCNRRPGFSMRRNRRGNRRPRYNRTCRRLGGNRWRRWRLHNRRSLPGQRHNFARRRSGCIHGSCRRRWGKGWLRRCWRDDWRSNRGWLGYGWRRCWPACCERLFFLTLLNGFQHVARL